MYLRNKKCKILVADDDHDLVNLLNVRLEAEGFEVLNAYEGIRVIEVARNKKPDLILLDVMMPTGTGQTVLKNLRAHPETKNIPVIVLTALGGAELEHEMRAAGAEDFLRKPYDAQDLLSRIRNLMESRQK
ncbi:MAG: response regulator [Deltaproteobacteria bacterium]|nr:response regulator [Deltaproteobacteria bacterium]